MNTTEMEIQLERIEIQCRNAEFMEKFFANQVRELYKLTKHIKGQIKVIENNE